jgi:hypothetical protein
MKLATQEDQIYALLVTAYQQDRVQDFFAAAQQHAIPTEYLVEVCRRLEKEHGVALLPAEAPTRLAPEAIPPTVESSSRIPPPPKTAPLAVPESQPGTDLWDQVGWDLQTTAYELGVELHYKQQYHKGPASTQLFFTLGRGTRFSKVLDLVKGHEFIVHSKLTEMPKARIAVEPKPGTVVFTFDNPVRETYYIEDWIRKTKLTYQQAYVNRPELVWGIGNDFGLVKAKLTNTLIGGSSDSGKTCVFTSAILGGMLAYPSSALKFAFADSKAKFKRLDGMPHCWQGRNCATTPQEIKALVKDLLNEVNVRRDRFASHGVYSLEDYNRMVENTTHKPEPTVVLCVDEGTDVEEFREIYQDLKPLARKGREYGLFIIFVTHRAAKGKNDVLDPQFNNQLRTRVVLQCSPADSRLIADDPSFELGATLPGRGAGYLFVNGQPRRFQGLFPDRYLGALRERL